MARTLVPTQPAFDPQGYTKGTKPLLVALTGAGISAESGLKTFRDSGGLWENHDVMSVASLEGWHRNPALVLEFYNQRRAQAFAAQPNAGHLALVALEAVYDVVIVTQNVDNLHEKAGSRQVVHLHGRLSEVRSLHPTGAVYEVGAEPIALGDCCPQGGQLRPNIVWFGEEVPLIGPAAWLSALADVYLVVGTSFNVYPAAGLLDEALHSAPKFLVDPHPPTWVSTPNLTVVSATAAEGLPALATHLASPQFLATLR